MKLTSFQNRVLDAIRKNPQATLQEIADYIGKKSRSNIYAHVANLIKIGVLQRTADGFVVIEPESSVTYIPFYGMAQCGVNDILAETNVFDYLPFPTNLLPFPTKDLFAIKAQGDSMEPTFTEGDVVLFRKYTNSALPKDGTIVLCYHGEGLKIKRFQVYRQEGKNTPRLISDNKRYYNPLDIDSTTNTQIFGVYVGKMQINAGI